MATWYGIYQVLRDDQGNPTQLANGPFGALQDEKVAKDAAQAMFGEDGFVKETNPDHLQGWGAGNAKDAKAFATTMVGKQEVELFFGEHPHSRRDDNIYARFPGGQIEGFSGHRLLHEIILKEYNYLKESELSGDEVRAGGLGEIRINGVLVDTFFFRDTREALINARHRLDRVHDHAIRLWDKKDVEKLVGRKVYYRDQPAVITRYFEDQACVLLKPEREKFEPPAWKKEEDKEDEWLDDDGPTIKEDIYSPHIWWYRDK